MAGFFRRCLQRLDGSIFFNPIYLVERNVAEKIRFAIAAARIGKSDRWLDVGCGMRPYESCFPAGTYVGVDVADSGRAGDLKRPDHYYDGKVLPFPDNSFDGVINTQVLEHVPDPLALLSEMHRVIKPEGTLIISLPFVWQEHEEPYDFLRFTRFGIASLMKQVGFRQEDVIRDTGAIETLAISLNVYITHNLVPPIRGFGRLIALLICFPIQLWALLLQAILPDRGQLYLNLVIRARKTAPSSGTK